MDNIVRVGLNYTFGQNAVAGGAASYMPTKAPMLKTAAASLRIGQAFTWFFNTGGSVGTGSACRRRRVFSTALGTNGLLVALAAARRTDGSLAVNSDTINSIRWVVGVEADWQWTSQKLAQALVLPPAALFIFRRRS